MADANEDQKDLLRIEGLKTYFHTDDGTAKAVDGVNYAIKPGETLGVVGESGSGKSVTALSILQLLPMPPGKFEGGRILFRGEDLLAAGEERLREIRGNEIAMIFQEPMTALNPVFTVGNQIAERCRLHQGLERPTRRGALDRDVAARGHPRAGAARGRVSAPALGRHAPAGDDRHGACPAPLAAHRGRADHRARRDHPGPDPGPDQDAPGGEPG